MSLPVRGEHGNGLMERNHSEQGENVNLVSKPLLVSFLLISHLAKASHTSELGVKEAGHRNVRRQ